MSPDFQLLASRIECFRLDDEGAVESFSRRLARENGWSELYARRTLREYGRFAFLAVTAGHSVTPSDAVDQAWHLHIIHTESYAAFCRDVLGRTLHHRPSRGGVDEFRKFERAYAQTLASYQRTFGSAPPDDIWPPTERCFAAQHRWVRVNAAEHWVVPRFDFATGWRGMAELWERGGRARWPLLLGLGAVVTGCASLGVRSPLDLPGPSFLGLLFALSLGGLLAAALAKSRAWAAKPEPQSERAEPLLHACEIAFLTGGAELCLEVALAGLVDRGLLRFDAERGVVTRAGSGTETLHSCERRVYDRVSEPGFSDVSALRSDARLLTREVERHLTELGLITPWSAVPLVLALLAPAFGVLKLIVGSTRHRPVGFLTLMVVLVTVLAMLWFWPRGSVTRRGNEVIWALRERHAALKDSSERSTPFGMGQLPLAVGLFGVGLLTDQAFAGVAPLFSPARRKAEDAGNPAATSGIDAGGDSSCGGGEDAGSGCGGGCGGCGGSE